MNDDLARIILLVGFSLVMPVGLYHRVRSRTDERLDRRQEGWLILLSLRPLALAFMVGMVTFLIDPNSMAWASFHLPIWARWSGVGLGIGAVGLLIWTFRSLGHNLTDTVVTRRNAILVTHGPYQWVRHPFYLAFALAVIANMLVTANLYLAITGTAAFLAIVARTSIEESKLIDRFGSDYVDYMKRTGRFLPRIRQGPI
ncbi:MAG: isoprenylcysteine carboxylmethyltransferase family protein [Pirellulales bacterium]